MFSNYTSGMTLFSETGCIEDCIARYPGVERRYLISYSYYLYSLTGDFKILIRR